MKIMGWLWVSIGLLFLSAQAAFGGGVWLYEAGTPDMGTAQAGRAALANDASTASFNPAGMSRLDRSQLMLALVGLEVKAKFSSYESSKGGGDGGDAGGFVPIFGFHYVHKLNDDVSLGISTGSYFGLGLDYGANWAGRYFIQEAELITYSVNPGISYRISDMLSVGFGVSLVYGELDQKVALANLEPGADGQLSIEEDDTEFGFNLGVLVEPMERLRLGLTYRSEVEMEFKDSASLTNVGPGLQALLNSLGLTGSTVDLGLNIPQAIMASGVFELTDQWSILANVGWQDWSAFGQQTLTFRSNTATSLTQDHDYDDTWHFALGAQYRFDDPWLWSFGMAYDTSPMDRSTRTPDAPLDRQVRIGTGIQYDINADMTVGAAYEFIDAGAANMDLESEPLRGTLRGDYSTNEIHAFAVNFNYKF
ncbi:OmpP1/FadL family transporter [Desulfoluna butyratoxydans]|uniref:Outer membrane protein transport protein (Ompp1/fadl/todx) n=1 Tax=Desulfoluna butyratoxydans TaxID=231438 RepID=A0A4U8YML6_9BACT|nr:outer membrane protein transport protein [Desulfoluna butyratoxydans]VFQ44990.1 outer membrane protein transport protein (ompp1/fadl/todx) [Desulfoluna butyratoxydans]